MHMPAPIRAYWASESAGSAKRPTESCSAPQNGPDLHVMAMHARDNNSASLSRLIWSYPEMVLGPFQAACFGPMDYN